MNFEKIAEATFVFAASLALSAAAHAQDAERLLQDGQAIVENSGTMALAPGSTIARTMTDEELAKQRGGFMGIAFSANFEAIVTNVNGNVTGTGTSGTSTSGVTNSNPPLNFNVQGGQVLLSTYVGNLTNLNGVFQLTAVNGVGNIVNSNLTLNIALVNVGNGAAIPSMTSLFGR